MTPEQQQKVIAETQGWRVWQGKTCLMGLPSKTFDEPMTGVAVPDYFNDLNVWQAVEKSMLPEECYAYQAALSDVLGSWSPKIGATNWLWHASAPQRCKAFLKLSGKWSD